MALGFIISPAKKMNVVEGPPYVCALPRHLAKTQRLQQRLEELSFEEAQDLWKCSERLAQQNFAQIAGRDLTHSLTAACLAYEGIQYQHLAPHVMDERCLAYLDAHLRILSGFYGVLRPRDGVTPYRLEMQARLALPASANAPAATNLYEFWADSLAADLAQDFDVVCNVASVEYAKAVVPHLRERGVRVITCLFGSLRASDGAFVQRSTEAKATRGTFVRWCAEHDVTSVEQLPSFDERSYRWSAERSSADELVFVKA